MFGWLNLLADPGRLGPESTGSSDLISSPPRSIRRGLFSLHFHTTYCAILKFDGPLREWALGSGEGSLARVELEQEGRCGYKDGQGNGSKSKVLLGGVH